MWHARLELFDGENRERFIENNDNDVCPSYQPVHEVNNDWIKMAVEADRKSYTITYKKRTPARARCVFNFVGWGWRHIGVQWRGAFKITLQVERTGQMLEIRCLPRNMGHVNEALTMYFEDWRLSRNTKVRLVKVNIEP